MTQTTNYNIDKPEANDALSVLVTFNGDMDIIDAAIKGVDDTATTASAAATAAGSAAATAQSAAETAQTTATAAASAASSAADAASAAQSTADAKAAIDDTAAAATTTYSSEKIETELDTKQTAITGAATTITDSNLTTSRALVSNAVGKVAASDVTTTELGYLSGATSNLQTQINNKASNNWTLMLDEKIPDNTTDYTVPSLSGYKEFCVIFRHSDYAIDCETMPYNAFNNVGGIWFSDNNENTIVLHPNNTTIRINGNVTLGAGGYRVLIYVR